MVIILRWGVPEVDTSFMVVYFDFMQDSGPDPCAMKGANCRVFGRSFFLETLWNYEKMQNLGLSFCVYPAGSRGGNSFCGTTRGDIDLMIPEEEIVEKTLTVGNRLGLHARVATMMVQSMRNYSCQVTLVKDGVEVDARSVLGLLLLAASPGSEIVVRAQGPDGMEAINEISRIIQDEESEES